MELPLLNQIDSLIEIRKSDLGILSDYDYHVEKYNRKKKIYDKKVKNNRKYYHELINTCGESCSDEEKEKLSKTDRELLSVKENLNIELSIIRSKKEIINTINNRKYKSENNDEIIRNAAKKYEEILEKISEEKKNLVSNNVKKALQSHGLQALGILFLPVVYLVLRFYAVAPFAARARPLVLYPSGPSLHAGVAGVSVDVPIPADSELLLRSGLMSSASNVQGSDELVLDNSMPLTCYAAGLYNLQRLRFDQDDHAVVTGTDTDHRVTLIEVPEGGAVVVQPRALVGVVKKREQRLVISRPWRWRWLISWLTLQFRYIVFHGPCTLIVQGHGGVEVEEAERGRMINKQLTLGFDAGLSYGAARTVSFLPYFNQEVSLFNDSFSGKGRYFFEHRPDRPGKGSIVGRWLSGLGDAVLSAFGI